MVEGGVWIILGIILTIVFTGSSSSGYYVFYGAFEGGEKIIKFTVAESEQISTCKEDLLDFIVPGKKGASL